MWIGISFQLCKQIIHVTFEWYFFCLDCFASVSALKLWIARRWARQFGEGNKNGGALSDDLGDVPLDESTRELKEVGEQTRSCRSCASARSPQNH